MNESGVIIAGANGYEKLLIPSLLSGKYNSCLTVYLPEEYWDKENDRPNLPKSPYGLSLRPE
jgi:hypothetical protein